MTEETPNEMDSSNHEVAAEEAEMADVTAADTQANDGPPPRLMISKMELENFKSYAGVKEIGPFHKCFSAVVGPNGSGKSNVIDAMLFVFGKRAKKLRLNKVSELIHKSDGVKDNPPTSARVSVFFQEIIDTGLGDTDYEVVPNTQRVVTRVAHKNNSSTYKLDGKNCSFRDVAAFLDSKGIDLDNNRFLILQGEVEMISMMPPKGKTEDDDGLLEYLEDIIGSSKYVEDTNLASQKVDQLTEQRQEKLNRVKAVEKEKDNLAGAKQEAEALLSKEREIRRKRNMLYQIHSMRETKTIDKLTEKKEAMEQKLQAEKEKENTTAERVQELENAFQELHKEHKIVSDELKVTKDEFAAFERRDIKLRADIKHSKAQLKKAATKVANESKKEADAIEKGQEAEESIPGIEESIVELTERKATEDEKLEEIQEEVKGVTQGLRGQLEEKTQELSPVNQELTVFRTALDTANTEVKLLEDSTTRAKERLAKSEEELACLDEKQQSKREELSKGEKDLSQARKRLVDVEKEEKTLGDKESSLAQKSRDLMARSEEAKAALQSGGNGQQPPAVKGILKAARAGGELSKFGILGRLGDLCTTNAKYDVAVSTACGSLNHIVVQTTAGAQKCLEFLRKHNLGRANFIPLDKMKKGAHDRQVETPEGAPRLFELITPGNFAVTPALFLAVGNTLVAPDLETATRWAYDFKKRWRVVTLDGKLIESSGTMAGGGKAVKRGGMRLANGGAKVAINPIDQSSAEDCKRLEEESAKALELVQQCRQRRRALTDESRELRKSIKSLEIKVPKLSLEVEGFDTSRKELTKLIPELCSKCELTPEEQERLEELQEKVSKCKSDMSSCEKEASKLEAIVSKLQQEILDAGGSKLKKQQKTCEKLLNELNEAEKALNSAKVTVTSSKKAAAKAKKQMEAAEKEKQQFSDTVDEKKTEIKALEEKAQAVMEAYNKVMELEGEKRTELEEAKAECDALKKSHAAARCTEIELQGQVEAAERQLVDSKSNRKRWEKEIQKLMSKEKEDDEFDFSDDEEEEDEDQEEENETLNEDGDDVEMSEAGEMEEGATKESETPRAEKTKTSSKSSLATFTFATLEKYNVDDLKCDIDKLEGEHNTLSKNANMGAIAEYKKKEADYLSRIEELDQVTEERNACRKEHDELRRKRLEMFMDGFGKITLKLKEMYQMITLGGDAELELVDSLDPFSEGIVFSVRPPKKSWKNISNLSGGEKTLSSLALVFALHHYKPTPLYVMDEIDAALDFKNVSIVANYIKERTKNAQFIIISLRNNMFELADRLVGIYKTNNATKSISIDPKAFGVSQSQNGARTPARPLAEKTNTNTKSPASGVRRKMSYSMGDEESTQGSIVA